MQPRQNHGTRTAGTEDGQGANGHGANGHGSPLLSRYLDRIGGSGTPSIDPAAAAVYATLDHLGAVAPSVAAGVVAELRDQRRHLKLIASENDSSLAVQLAQGNLLTDKYAEGYPGHRFYAGCETVDALEAEGAGLARALFGADHAYLQPHSGADANLVAFAAILAARVRAPLLAELGIDDPTKVSREAWEGIRAAANGQLLLALDYAAGAHLTHGYRHNLSAQLFDVHHYGVDPVSKRIDLDALRARVREVRPLILLAGYSAYPRSLDIAAMRTMADEVGAVLMVDMAHFAGLVAGKVFRGDFDPVRHADVVTLTTHKTLRGPRGGMVLCTDAFAPWVDKGCPAVIGGPLPHVLAAKVVALREASTPAFRAYAQRIVANARALAAACRDEGMAVVTGGTDNHLLLLDVAATFGLTGRQAEAALRGCGLTLNRNALPFDDQGPWYTSGLRLGTPAATTLGMGEPEVREIAAIVRRALAATTPTAIATGVRAGHPSRAAFRLDEGVARERVAALLARFPLYPELDAALGAA